MYVKPTKEAETAAISIKTDGHALLVVASISGLGTLINDSSENMHTGWT